MEVAGKRLPQFAEGGFREQVRASLARHAREQMVDQVPGSVTPKLGGANQWPPASPQSDANRFSVAATQVDAAAAASLGAIVAAAVLRDAAQDAVQALRQRGAYALVLERLTGHAQVQVRGVPHFHVRRQLLHVLEQRLLEHARLLEAFLRGALHRHMNERRECGVVGGDAEGFEIVQRGPNRVGADAGLDHEFIRRDALVWVRRDEHADDGEQLSAPGLRQGASGCKPSLRLLHRLHPQRRWEHTHVVFVAGEERCLLQPRDGGSHPCVVGRAVALEGTLVVLQEDFARCRRHLATESPLAVDVPQRAQDAVDFPPREPGAGRHAELVFDILDRVEQDAARRLAVSASPPRLLQVVLQ